MHIKSNLLPHSPMLFIAVTTSLYKSHLTSPPSHPPRGESSRISPHRPWHTKKNSWIKLPILHQCISDQNTQPTSNQQSRYANNTLPFHPSLHIALDQNRHPLVYYACRSLLSSPFSIYLLTYLPTYLNQIFLVARFVFRAFLG